MAAGLSVTLALCIAGASFAAGALLVEPDAAPIPSSAAAGAHHGAVQPGYGGASDVAPSQDVGGTEPTLTIDEFTIQSISVSPGAQVTVVNADSAAHTVTAEDGGFDTGTIDAGATGTFTAPTVPGTYQVFCSIHPNMRATITVA
jgi:plastocyanin